MTPNQGGDVAPIDRNREAMDDLDLLLGALPHEVVVAVHALPDKSQLIEVVLDLGRRPEADVSGLVDFGLGVIRARTTKGGDHRHDHGVIAPVRTYESPIDRRLEDAGFDSIASVNLLMKETLVRVAEPALVPAGVR